MKPLAIFAVCAAAALPGLALAQPFAPFDDAPVTYPWRNGSIAGPGGPAPGPAPLAQPAVFTLNGGAAAQYPVQFDGGGPPGGFQGQFPQGQGFDQGGGPPGGFQGQLPPAAGGPVFPAGPLPGPGPGQAPPVPVAAGGSAVFPAPNSGAYAVSQNPDGTITVTRFGPVWSSSVGPKGWAHRHYYSYGWPVSGISVPFVSWPFGSTK
jgi:hypothetical protein